MNELTHGALNEVAQKVLAGQITFGRLMSPEQVRLAVAGRSGPEGQLKEWCITSEVDKQMFRQMKRAGTWQSGMALHTLGSQRYLLVSHAIGGWRHHTVLPLIGQTAQRFIDSLATGPLRISLANGHEDDALLQTLRAPNGFPTQTTTSLIAPDSDVKHLCMGLMLYAGLMTLPRLQADVGTAEAPRRICVSVVAPDDLQELAVWSACEPPSSTMN